MPFAELSGTDLYYEEYGEGAAVVFLHGAGSNHLVWWQQIPAFSQRYRCIVIDHRGFGRSTDPSQEGPTRFGDDLQGLLDHLGVERAALVCQSMGGNTAMRFAVRYPERVSALVLGGSWGFLDWPDPAARLREALAAGVAAMPQRGNPGLGSRYKTENPAGTFLYQEISALNPARPETAAKITQGAPTPDDVAQLRLPALFIRGLDDVLVAQEDMRAVCALIPGAELVEYRGLGHSVHWEDPAAFNGRVLTFLRQHT